MKIATLVCSVVLVIIGFVAGIAATSWYVVNKGTNPVAISHEDEIVSSFHRLYHNNWWDRTVLNTYWMGTEAMQCPLDMWVLQEIIYEIKPNVIIETGTRRGGSTLFFASIFQLMKHGRVISIDIVEYEGKPKHDRITYLLGSSTSEEIINTVKGLIEPGEKVMVFLDSDHSKSHVLDELRLYSPLVSAGSYLIICDTHLNGHPVFTAASSGPGPMEALEEWFPQHPEFKIDKSREKYGLTFFPNGYLRRQSE
jgi:cephalosporin hydroxylase